MLRSLLLFISLIAFNVFATENCINCHQDQVSNWQQSDHAKAMSVANSKTIIADFNNTTTEHFTQKSRFYIENNQYLIDLSEQGKTSTYQVKYTFGHYPLQQYLVEADGGRLQVIPFAWDSRAKSEGGQRWYPNFAAEDIHANDRLHWQQPLQNWNGMCADCHSDGLKRNYDIKTNHFETTWDNINVGCQSCHGKMTEHSERKSKINKTSSSKNLTDSEQQKELVLNWLLKPGEKVARLHNQTGKLATKTQKEQHGEFMQTCFACHALRSPLTDGFKPQHNLMEQFSPSFLTPPFYHADGQIKEEVYVYGSFLQSKMYDEGVTCLNCHDQHTMKIKSQTNGLCLQCHSSETYQQEKHTRHPLESSGGQCVNCHMPETTYMGVDARRDHSFKIPRPDLSDQYNTPNACINCHTDQTNKWAAEQLVKWHGHPQDLTESEQSYVNLMHQQYLPLEQHLKLINDKSLATIKRASAIMMLPNTTQMLSDTIIKPWVENKEPLIRLAIARVGQLLPDSAKFLTYQTLLNDKYKAIRVAAANVLIHPKLQNDTLFSNAFKELVYSNNVNAWRGEGNLNQSLIQLKQQKLEEAIISLKNSIKVDPYFVSSYVNLSDIYRQQQEKQLEQQIYELGLNNNPKSAEIHYAYGLFLIRAGDKPKSVNQFKLAMQYDINNSRYPYLYFLALDATGQTPTALAELKTVISKYNNDENLVNLGLSFSQKLKDRQTYQYFISLRK